MKTFRYGKQNKYTGNEKTFEAPGLYGVSRYLEKELGAEKVHSISHKLFVVFMKDSPWEFYWVKEKK